MKRLIDFCVALVAFFVLSPVFLTASFLILFNLGSPILFCQISPGLQGKPFKMYKFRSMLNRLDKDGLQFSDAERLTKFGRFLRSTSLDELPGLWNVLKGDMSLVGPRPLLMEYLPLIPRHRPVAMKCARALPGGRRSTGAMPWGGTRNSRSMSGMWTITTFGWISG